MDNNNDATLAQIIGCNIKKLRVTCLGADGKARLQKECAETVGATQQQWAAWEAGKHIPGDEYLRAIATMFGVTKKSLWAGDSPPASAGGAVTVEELRPLLDATATIHYALQQSMIDVAQTKIRVSDMAECLKDILAIIEARRKTFGVREVGKITG